MKNRDELLSEVFGLPEKRIDKIFLDVRSRIKNAEHQIDVVHELKETYKNPNELFLAGHAHGWIVNALCRGQEDEL